MRALRLAITAASFAALATASETAFADNPPHTCSIAYTRGHEERLAGRLFNARKAFLECSAAHCSTTIVADCRRWTSEVEADLPTIRIRVTDERGKHIDQLAVFSDGERIPATQLSGPIILEAGPHELRFEAPGYETVRLDKALRPSDREVDVVVTLRPPRPATPRKETAKPASRGVPTISIAFASVGVLSLAGALYFGSRAQNEYEDLKRTCAPNCRESEADSMYAKAIVSDVALITSVAAFGAAAYFYFSNRSAAASTNAVGVKPQTGGAELHWRASF
jgi:hypothetical protein